MSRPEFSRPWAVDPLFQSASVYVRQVGFSAVQWVDGPLSLEDADRNAREWVQDALDEGHAGYGAVMYYEVRGIGVCRVRYRLWIERPPAFIREEVVPRRIPGRTATAVRKALGWE